MWGLIRAWQKIKSQNHNRFAFKVVYPHRWFTWNFELFEYTVFSTLPLIASISCLILTFLLTTKKTKLSFFFLFWWKKRKLCSKFHSHPKKTPQQHGMKPATYVVVFVMMLMFFYPFRHSVPAPRAMGTRCENTFANILGKSRLSPIDISCLHSERKKPQTTAPTIMELWNWLDVEHFLAVLQCWWSCCCWQRHRFRISI